MLFVNYLWVYNFPVWIVGHWWWGFNYSHVLNISWLVNDFIAIIFVGRMFHGSLLSYYNYCYLQNSFYPISYIIIISVKERQASWCYSHYWDVHNGLWAIDVSKCYDMLNGLFPISDIIIILMGKTFHSSLILF